MNNQYLRKNLRLPSAFPTLLLAAAASAGPVTTVPWNGYPGAASFTYDDARTSQVPNLLPQLEELGLKATFFISVTGTGGDFEAKKSAWIQAAKDGHELANHTKAHINLPAEPQATTVIKEMADYLRALDDAVESVTFAYPNCNINQSGKAGVDKEDFVARGCGQTTYAWNREPSDWMNIQGLILTPTNVNSAVSLMGTAKSGNGWAVTIVHDVKENPDQYSLTPADNRKMLQAGKDNGLWIETFEKVGAYYRAHFTMDTVKAIVNQEGWKFAWKAPHAKLPSQVMLRVKLDEGVFGETFTLLQDGAVIPKETDGSYVIDFMKLEMQVSQRPTALAPAARLPERIAVRPQGDGLIVAGVQGSLDAVLTDLEGRTVFRGSIADGIIPLREDRRRGILFLRLVQPLTGRSMHALVPTRP